MDALEVSGIAFDIVRHGPVRSLAEAAAARGVEPADVIKTIVIRRGVDDYLFVLVPGDRTIAWPKLRAVLGVSRLSMPDAATAKEVTGYDRGRLRHSGRFDRGRSSPTSASAAAPSPSERVRMVSPRRWTATRLSPPLALGWPT